MDQNSDLYLIRPKFCLYLYLDGCQTIAGFTLDVRVFTVEVAQGWQSGAPHLLQPDPPEDCWPQVRDLGASYCTRSLDLDDTTNERSKSVMPLPRVKIAQIRKLFLLHLFVACEIAWPQQMHTKLEMWVNAQSDGRPAEYRWRPLLNAAVWLTTTTRVPCSNAAKPRIPLKLPGVPQTNETISPASRPKFTMFTIL